MKIDELAKETGFDRQSIYRCIRMGLLPKPAKAGFREASFDESHARILKRIRELRVERHLSFGEIRNLLPFDDMPPATNEETFFQDRKKRIMDKAITLFSKYGFENTKISDITDSLDLGKGTFYLYFKSKKDLFIECIGRLSMIVVSGESWDQVRNEPDFIERQRITLGQFLKAFPTFSGILNLVGASLQSDDPEIAEKARNYYKILSKWLRRDLRRAMEDKAIREVNTDIVSVLMLGMAEGLGNMLMVNPDYTMEQGMEVFIDVLERGLGVTGTGKGQTTERTGRTWEVTDSKGFKVPVKNVRFNDREELPLFLGEGEVRLPLSTVTGLAIRNEDGYCLVTVTQGDGGEHAFTADGKTRLSGESPFGGYSVTLEKLSGLSLAPEPKGGSSGKEREGEKG